MYARGKAKKKQKKSVLFLQQTLAQEKSNSELSPFGLKIPSDHDGLFIQLQIKPIHPLGHPSLQDGTSLLKKNITHWPTAKAEKTKEIGKGDNIPLKLSNQLDNCFRRRTKGKNKGDIHFQDGSLVLHQKNGLPHLQRFHPWRLSRSEGGALGKSRKRRKGVRKGVKRGEGGA